MLAILVVVLAIGGVYIEALGGPFLWDDRLLVLDAPLVENGASLTDHLRQPFWMGAGAQPHSTTYYRPLVTLSYALDHRLHGSNSGGYHLTNLLCHTACAVLLLGLLRRAGVRSAVAALVAGAWALLPRLAEAAAWISGRTDLLATLFVLAALLAWGPSLPRRLLAALSFGLALLAKESAVALLPALALQEWLGSPPGTRSVRRLLASALPLLLVLAAYVAGRLTAVGYTDQMPSLGAGARALTVLQALGTYLLMLLDPLRPRAVVGRLGALDLRLVALGVVGVALAVFLLVRFRRRTTPGVAGGLALAGAALLPVLHVFPIPLRTLAADRFLYLPSAGLALAFAPTLDAWLAARRVRWAGAVASVVVLAAVTRARVGVWADETEFWARTYLETPSTNIIAANELFGVYYRAGLLGDALTIIERALRYDDPNKKDPRYNAAICLSRLGRREEAAERFRLVRRTTPDADFHLAAIELQSGRFDSAYRMLEALSRSGHRGGRILFEQFPALKAARTELTSLDEHADPERRAELATFLGDEPTATRAWTAVARKPGVSKDALENALRYLVRTGERAGLELAVGAHLARFGALSPELAGMVAEHLMELERLIGLRERVGLSGSAVKLAGER